MNAAAIALGAVLASAPFVALTVLMVCDAGWVDAMKVWGITFAVTASIAVGIGLIFVGVNT